MYLGSAFQPPLAFVVAEPILPLPFSLTTTWRSSTQFALEDETLPALAKGLIEIVDFSSTVCPGWSAEAAIGAASAAVAIAAESSPAAFPLAHLILLVEIDRAGASAPGSAPQTRAAPKIAAAA